MHYYLFRSLFTYLIEEAQKINKPISSLLLILILSCSDMLLADQVGSLEVDDPKISFIGNNFFSDDNLRKKLFVFDDSGFYEPQLIVNNLIALYKNNGFLRTNIAIKKRPHNELIFHIKEGERAKLNNIKIVGILERRFQPIIKNAFAKLKQFGYFDLEKFNNFVSEVKEELANFGYWDFEVTNYKLTPNKNLSFSDLVLIVEQGHRRALRKVIIQNDLGLNINLENFKLPNFKKGSSFDVRLIEKYKNLIAQEISSSQRNIIIKHEIISNDNSQRHKNYTLSFKLLLKSINYFGAIKINGCIKTLPHVIKQHLAFKEGDAWDFGKIEESLKKLKDLNIFKSISIVPDDFFDKNPKKSVQVNVIEDSAFEILTRIGFAQNSEMDGNQPFGFLSNLTYKFGGSFLWKNISGISDIFSLDVNRTGASTNFAASYKRPLAYPGLFFNTKVFNNQIEQSLPGFKNNLDKKAYIENHAGVMFNLDYTASKFNFCLSSALDYIKVSTSNRPILNILDINTEFFKKTMPYFILEPSIEFKNLDDDMDPTRGYSTSIKVKAMAPLHDVSQSFVKFFLQHVHFMPITDYSSIAFKFKAGYIASKNFETILPTERFYLGGLNSVRSYEQNMAPPLASIYLPSLVGMSGTLAVPTIMPDASTIHVPLGAKFLMNLSTEWHCKLFDKLSGVIFNDIGFISHNTKNLFSPKDIVGATGFGLRYVTPIGPIRFDIGFKWKRQKNEKPFNWYLTFGESF